MRRSGRGARIFSGWILSLVRFWDRAAGLLACGDGSDTGVWEERQAGVVRGANGRLRGGPAGRARPVWGRETYSREYKKARGPSSFSDEGPCRK